MPAKTERFGRNSNAPAGTRTYRPEPTGGYDGNAASAAETSRRLRRSFSQIQTICTAGMCEKARFGPHGECRRGPKRERFGSARGVNRRFALAHRRANRKAAEEEGRAAEQIVDIRKNPPQNAHGGGPRA
ncbi:MAG: hypothetical protein IJC51_04000, partial [Eggerthellaceae bacterium]|nr:hypothetical protein [Eggerthellaceae bacterium]